MNRFFECTVSGKRSTFHVDDGDDVMRLEMQGMSVPVADLISLQIVGRERIRIAWQTNKKRGRHAVLMRVTNMPVDTAYGMIAKKMGIM